MIFDANNGNTTWKYIELLELKKMCNLDPFDYLGHATSTHITPGHTKIQLHIINEYNQYVRYNARMVTSGNITGTNLDTYYSSVIPLRSLCTVFLLAEMNNIETCTGDISNVCLTAHTTEKIIFNSGPEFSPFGHAGHLLLIKTAL